MTVTFSTKPHVLTSACKELSAKAIRASTKLLQRSSKIFLTVCSDKVAQNIKKIIRLYILKTFGDVKQTMMTQFALVDRYPAHV